MELSHQEVFLESEILSRRCNSFHSCHFVSTPWKKWSSTASICKCDWISRLLFWMKASLGSCFCAKIIIAHFWKKRKKYHHQNRNEHIKVIYAIARDSVCFFFFRTEKFAFRKKFFTVGDLRVSSVSRITRFSIWMKSFSLVLNVKADWGTQKGQNCSYLNVLWGENFALKLYSFAHPLTYFLCFRTHPVKFVIIY